MSPGAQADVRITFVVYHRIPGSNPGRRSMLDGKEHVKGARVSRRLLRLEIPVFPDRRMFRLHDATVDPDGPGSPAPPDGALISVTREQMWVASLQEIVSAQLLLEEWDSAPPPFGEKWEDEAKAVLYLRGAVSIDMGTAGKAVDSLKLAGGVGDYVVRVFARNRSEVPRRYRDSHASCTAYGKLQHARIVKRNLLTDHRLPLC